MILAYCVYCYIHLVQGPIVSLLQVLFRGENYSVVECVSIRPNKEDVLCIIFSGVVQFSSDLLSLSWQLSLFSLFECMSLAGEFRLSLTQTIQHPFLPTSRHDYWHTSTSVQSMCGCYCAPPLCAMTGPWGASLSYSPWPTWEILGHSLSLSLLLGS